MGRAVLFTLALALGGGHGFATSLGEIYSIIRPIYCAIQTGASLQAGQAPSSCPLPPNIVVPASDNTVWDLLSRSSDILIVGRVPTEARVKEILANRVARGPQGKAVWVVLSPSPDLEDWAKSLEADKAQGGFRVEVVPVEASDALGTVSRVPFAVMGSWILFPLADSGIWMQPVGSVAATVAAVLKTAVSYGVQQAQARKAMQAREALP